MEDVPSTGSGMRKDLLLQPPRVHRANPYPRIPVVEQVLLGEIGIHGGWYTLWSRDTPQQLLQHTLCDGDSLVGSQLTLGKERWHKMAA